MGGDPSQERTADPSFKVEAFLFVGNKARDLGNYDEAISHYRAVLEIDPNEWRAYYGLGNVASDQAFLAREMNQPVTVSTGLRSKAIEDFRRAVELSRSDDAREEVAELYSDLAQAYIYKGDYVSAQEWVNKALELNRNCASAIRRQGSILLSQYLAEREPTRRDESKLENARKKYGESLLKEPKNHLTHRALGAAYYQKYLKDRDRTFLARALAEFKEAVGLRHDYVAGYLDIGLVHFEQGEHRQAIAPYQKALALNPRLVYARANLITSMCKVGERTAAETEYEELRRRDAEYARGLESQMRNCGAR